MIQEYNKTEEKKKSKKWMIILLALLLLGVGFLLWEKFFFGKNGGVFGNEKILDMIARMIGEGIERSRDKNNGIIENEEGGVDENVEKTETESDDKIGDESETDEVNEVIDNAPASESEATSEEFESENYNLRQVQFGQNSAINVSN